MVSIITPSYNSSLYIAETINSVLAQNYTHWEMLIVDDASIDNTCSIVEGYVAKEKRIKLIKLAENKGAGVARNIAIERSNRRLMLPFWMQMTYGSRISLEVQISFMIEQSKVAMCFSSYDLMDANGNSLQKTITAVPELNYEKLLRSNYVGNLTGYL